MGLLKIVKRYKRRLAKRFSREISRKQLNIATDRSLVAIIRLMAHQLGIPIYVLCEHSLQLGIAEIYTLTQDEALKDQLCRHLVQDHLLTPVTRPEAEPISRRVLRIENTLRFLDFLDKFASREEQKAIISKVIKEAVVSKEFTKRERKDDGVQNNTADGIDSAYSIE